MTFIRNIAVLLLLIGFATSGMAQELGSGNLSDKQYNKLNGLKIQHRENRKTKVIPLNSKVTVMTRDTLVKGTLLKIADGKIYLEDKSFDFNEIESIGHKHRGTLLKGIGISLLGGVLVAGGTIFALTSAQPAPGALAFLAGVATVSMAPSVFKYGNRYHMDGEWMIIGPNADSVF